jgi:hypothetical protein
MAPRLWGNAVTEDFVPTEISDRQFFQELAIMGLITKEAALGAVMTGTLPAQFVNFIAALPEDEQFDANMQLCGATVFKRNNKFVSVFGMLQGMTEADLDALWKRASQL